MRKITKEMSVYLVDDDADDRMIFTRAIAEVAENCSLVAFTSGQQLIDTLRAPEARRERPDVIFLDINMPVITGLETLEVLRTELMLHSLPIAMYSTSNLETDISQALVAGANLYISKPNNFNDLTGILMRALNAIIQYDSSCDYRTFVMSI